MKTNFEGVNIDNSFYATEYSNNFIEPKNKIINDKKNFLVIGDSQANNFYMSLVLNQNKVENFAFNFININEIKCIYILYFAINEKNNCQRNILNLSQINLIEKSDYIFFTKRWRDEDLNYLDSFISKIKMKGRVIISNQNVPFRVIYQKITPLDLFIIMNKKFPNKNELEMLETKYYSYYSGNLKYKEMNKRLESIAIKHSIKFIDRTSFQCIENDTRCFVLSDKNKKLVYDIDHFTIDGAKFFGQKFIESSDFNFFKNKN
ncbi:SGNH hydrolase domain-containing protein [Candidatus Pelagibacter sp.]|nr:SGNH hydrolase domain-containing protein [Candidatus Pelagibacter sp.]